MGRESSVTVLIVDDESPLVDLYSSWLNGEYTVRTATSGQQALDQIDEHVDVVLLDRKMPSVTGSEVLDEIREREIGCQVVMVTAVEPEADVIEMGFDDYLTKPVSEDELHDAVESMLSRTNYERQLREYFALVSKRAALQASAELEKPEPRFRELHSRLDDVKNEIADQLSEFTDRDCEAVFSKHSQDDNPDRDSGNDHSMYTR